MKRLLLFLSAIFIATTAIAHTINWYVDGSVYHTTTCESGENVTPPTAPEKYGYTFQGWGDYTPIEYIESTGTQYIDTQLLGGLDSFSFDTKITCDYLTDGQYYILGNFNQYGQSGIMLHPDNPDNVVFTYYLDNKINRIILGQTNEILHITKQNNLIYVNNKVITSIPNNTSQLKNSALLLWGTGIGQSFNALGKVYYLKIWQNGILIRDFIPVLDKNGTPCIMIGLNINSITTPVPVTLSQGQLSVNNL